MPRVRKPLAKGLVGVLVLVTSLLAVGLTASADRPFTISIQPMFFRLGLDLEVKLGSLHLRASWSAITEPWQTLAVSWDR